MVKTILLNTSRALHVNHKRIIFEHLLIRTPVFKNRKYFHSIVDGKVQLITILQIEFFVRVIIPKNGKTFKATKK